MSGILLMILDSLIAPIGAEVTGGMVQLHFRHVRETLGCHCSVWRRAVLGTLALLGLPGLLSATANFGSNDRYQGLERP